MTDIVCEVCSDNFNYELSVELQKENAELRARVAYLSLLRQQATKGEN